MNPVAADAEQIANRSARALIEANAQEATDLIGELTLLLDRIGNESAYIAAARMVTRRIADRLGQLVTLQRLERGGGVRPDMWSPIAVLEELEHEAIALEDSEVCVIPFTRLDAAAQRFPEVRREMYRLLSRDISRDHGLMLLLGVMTAEQRLATFLLNLSRRYARLGFDPDHFILRMSREEIGSYLGLTLETVSRNLSRFQRDKMITAHHREIRLKDVAALREIAGC